jgi:hypothetical protein
MRALFGFILMFTLSHGLAAPAPKLWSIWLPYKRISKIRINHKPWQRFLTHYVHITKKGAHRVDYAAVSRGDTAKLHAYLQALQATSVRTLNRSAQLAYWINLYNAETVYLVLTHPDIGSIKDIDISPGLFSSGPWGAKVLTVEKNKLSLNDIEHRILRPIFKTNLIHFAVNCAAIGCPNLSRTAYTQFNVSKQLAKNARAFVNSPQGMQFKHGKLFVSKIFTWYQQDFGGNEAGVVAFLKSHANRKNRLRLKQHNGIDGSFYDWALNKR